MIDKFLEGLYRILFILAVIVSIRYFGVSFSLLVSIAFILLLFAQRALQRILSSGISVLAPFVLHSAKTSILTNYEYKIPINIVNGIFNRFNVNYCLTKDMVDTVLVYTLLFVAASIFFREDKTTIGKKAPGGNPELKEKTFIDRQNGFCKFLSQKLESINLQQNWNNELYVPIETEVELTKGHKVKRYDDIIKCLKKNKSRVPVFIKYCVRIISNSRIGKRRIINKITNYLEVKSGDNIVYLVLGEPGSGKSVSLRKLCSELLGETRVTGKIPVYISLQTWTPETGEWSKKNLPTKLDLINYIKSELYKDGDIFTNGFVDDYFELMLEDGRFYFIFDSFDEIPCLMGGDETGELITGISELFHQFLTSTNQNGGIIASRLYNRPSNDYLNQTYTLRLQRFDNDRVRKLLKLYLPTGANEIIFRLFKERIDLVELCRNPFHLSLLVDYIKNATDFPENQFELFKHFVEGRLDKSKTRVEEEGFTLKEIYNAAVDLSVMMQKDSNYGLDFPISRVYLSGNIFNKEQWEKCISVLTYAKICRIGGNRHTVSFVHRRFQEFFFVEAIIRGKEKITEKALIGILDNTGMRDALVLYCQIAAEDRIRGIIDFCYDTIVANENKIGGVLNESSVKLINSLYFLIESFSNRKELLNDRIDNIRKLREYLIKETHYTILVAIVNSISLLGPEDIQKLMLDVFRLNNRWLKALMVSKCQLIQKLDRKTEIGFCRFFENSHSSDLIHNFNNVDFSLSLSDCFAYIRKIHILWMGVIFSIAVHRWTILVYGAVIIGSEIKGMGAAVKDIIENLFGGTLHRMNMYDDSKYFGRSIMAIAENPISGIRRFIIINTLVLALLVFSITISESILSIRDKKDAHNKETPNTDKKFSIKLIVSIIGNFWRSIIDSLIKPKHKHRVEPSSPVSDNIMLMATGIVFVIGYCPTSPLLAIFAVLEAYITIYCLYRCIHEIIVPTIKNGDLVYVAKYLVTGLKKLPVILVEKITEIIALLIAVVTFYIVSALGIGGVVFIIPALICHLSGNEITAGNVFLIFMLLIIISLCCLLGYIIYTKVKDYTLLYRLSNINIQEIDRRELVLNLKKYTSKSLKRRYVKRLMDRDIKLYGDWPDDYTESIQDDVLIRRLAIWDSKGLTVNNSYIEMI